MTKYDPDNTALVNNREPGTIKFKFGGELLVEIYSDGRIERGPAFTTDDEVSLRFWHILAMRFPFKREPT